MRLLLADHRALCAVRPGRGRFPARQPGRAADDQVGSPPRASGGRGEPDEDEAREVRQGLEMMGSGGEREGFEPGGAPGVPPPAPDS